MKTNKPNKQPDPANNLTTFLQSMQNMEASYKALMEAVSTTSRRELLRALIQHWPHPFEVMDSKAKGGRHYVDSDKFEFKTGELLDAWDNGMTEVLRRIHNELEDYDIEFLKKQLADENPNLTLTMEMYVNRVQQFMEAYFPVPAPEPFYSFNGFTMEQKDYMMPALKVLNQDKDGMFWSPMYVCPWENNELIANHQDGTSPLSRLLAHTVAAEMHEQNFEEAMGHCDCGIYASVNMDELKQYVWAGEQEAVWQDKHITFEQKDHKLCIIEPYSDATVWMARKGWKASKAFVSEVVGETITINDASELLSMVWQRHLDVDSLYRLER